MNKPIPIMWQGDNIVMIVNNKTFTINKNTHMNYGYIVACIREENWDELANLVDVGAAIEEYTDGKMVIQQGVVTYGGRPLDNALATRLISFIKAKLPYLYLTNFCENLYQNVSHRSISQLYTFLEKNEMPITDDGCFMAYKLVKPDYGSRFSDTQTGERVFYHVGGTVSMDRNKISDDPAVLCHEGLHACSLKYLDKFGYHGDKILLVKINPRDVVCVPNVNNHTKLRVCLMDVVSEYCTKESGNTPHDVLNDSPIYNTDDSWTCLACGTVNSMDADWCTNCGHSDDDDYQDDNHGWGVHTIDEDDEPSWECPKCRRKNIDMSTSVCDNCGHNLHGC